MGLPDMDNVPESGAVFTLGRSRFADNVASHFFIRKDPVVYVTCGDEHSAVICQSGRLFVFGSNDWGQLGLGHKNHISKPSCVKVLKPDKVTHVACGRAHSLICTEERKIFTCGSDQEGQLGRGSSAFGDSSSSPVLVHDCEIAGTRVVGLAAGSHHSMLLTNDGVVLVWGSNLEGQLGLSGISGLVNEPTRVPIPEPVKRISAGYYHSAFLTESGRIYVCGESESGKLGIDVSFSTQIAPKQIQLSFPAAEVSCGGHHTLVLTENGNLYGAGSNASGQLGMGSDVTEVQTPKLLPRDAFHDDWIVQIACGESHSAVLTGSGKLFMCGDGRHGKLGLEENENNVHELTYAAKYQELFVSNVACGGCHTILVGRKRETIDRPQRVAEPVQLDNALPKKNTLPPLKLPVTRMQSELGAEGSDTSQPSDILYAKRDTEEDLATKNESSKEVPDPELSFAVENKQEEERKDTEEHEGHDNGQETSNTVGGFESDENVRSSRPRTSTETEFTAMIKSGNDETSAHTDLALCQHKSSLEPVEANFDTVENVHSDRAVYQSVEQLTDEITRVNSDKSSDRRSATSQKTRSANSKSGTAETGGIDTDNSSGAVSKLRAENLPSDADVIQSPAPRTGNAAKLSKDKRQAQQKNGAESCQGTHPRAKSKTCHIL